MTNGTMANKERMSERMSWIKVEDRLPEVNASGESDYVLACNAETRPIPKVVKYSNGEYSMRGWYTQRIGEYIPFLSGRGKDSHLTFTHWMKIELPHL